MMMPSSSGTSSVLITYSAQVAAMTVSTVSATLRTLVGIEMVGSTSFRTSSMLPDGGTSETSGSSTGIGRGAADSSMADSRARLDPADRRAGDASRVR